MGDEVASNCIVCYEEFTEFGDHKPVTISCGHMFGEKCIKRWLATEKSCPVCKKRAKKNSIRPVYAQKVAVGSEEVQKLKKELEAKNAEIDGWREQNRQIRSHKRLTEQMNRQLVEENKKLRMSLTSMGSDTSRRTSSFGEPSNIFVRTTTDAVPVENSKCFAMTKGLVCLMVERNSNKLLQRQIDARGRVVKGTTDLRDQGSGCVWDIDVSSDDSKAAVAIGNQLCIVTDLDKIGKAQVLERFEDDGQQIMSCAWDDDDCKVYCGLGDGRIQVFDIRNSGCAQELCNPKDHGIFSLVSGRGQIFGSTRQEVFVWKNDMDETPASCCKVEGSIGSLALDEDLLAVSIRPPNQSGVAVHRLMTAGVQIATLVGHESFHTKTRGSFIKCQDRTMFASGDEVNDSWCCWDVNSGVLLQRIGFSGTVRQICSQFVDGSTFVGVLDASSLSMFRYRGVQVMSGSVLF